MQPSPTCNFMFKQPKNRMLLYLYYSQTGKVACYLPQSINDGMSINRWSVAHSAWHQPPPTTQLDTNNHWEILMLAETAVLRYTTSIQSKAKQHKYIANKRRSTETVAEYWNRPPAVLGGEKVAFGAVFVGVWCCLAF